MTAPTTEPTGPRRPQSLLSEAVEQIGDLTTQYLAGVSALATQQADRFSSGAYGINDLVAGQIGTLRLNVRHTLIAAQTVPGVWGLLGYSPPKSGSGTREIRVSVPGNLPLSELKVPDLVQVDTGALIPSSAVELEVPESTEGVLPEAITVTVRVTTDHAGNGTYRGSLRSADNTVVATFVIAISEVGEPIR
jgi:hypothetical protein